MLGEKIREYEFRLNNNKILRKQIKSIKLKKEVKDFVLR